jgi:myosin-crossreactive antigen
VYIYTYISMASKPIQQQSSTMINEPIRLTKKQNEILTLVCDLYEMEVGEYIKDALIESLKEEITDGDFCVLLASKLDENKKENKGKTGDKAISHEASGISSYPFVG